MVQKMIAVGFNLRSALKTPVILRICILLVSFIAAGLGFHGCGTHRAHLSPPTQRLLQEIAAQNESTHPDSALVLSRQTLQTFQVIGSPRGFAVRAILRINDGGIEPELTKLGVQVSARIDDLWTATIPLKSLVIMSTMRGVDAIEVDTPVRKRPDRR